MKYWLERLDQRILYRLQAVHTIENKKTGEKTMHLQVIDAADIFILRYLVDFYESGSMVIKEINSKKYFWAHYDSILEELPILHIRKEAVASRFKKYENLGLIEIPPVQHGIDYYIEDGKCKKRWGTYSYFRFTDLMQQCLKPKDIKKKEKSLKLNEETNIIEFKKSPSNVK